MLLVAVEKYLTFALAEDPSAFAKVAAIRRGGLLVAATRDARSRCGIVQVVVATAAARQRTTERRAAKRRAGGECGREVRRLAELARLVHTRCVLLLLLLATFDKQSGSSSGTSW